MGYGLSSLLIDTARAIVYIKTKFSCADRDEVARTKEEGSMAHAPGVLPEGDVRSDEEIQDPKQYRIILHNDDYTTMDFVIEVLVSVFHKPTAEATKIMLDVHKRGKGICGVYTYDIAATKTAQVHQMAKMREFPLKCSLEEA